MRAGTDIDGRRFALEIVRDNLCANSRGVTGLGGSPLSYCLRLGVMLVCENSPKIEIARNSQLRGLACLNFDGGGGGVPIVLPSGGGSVDIQCVGNG